MTIIEKYKDNKKLFDFICESYPHCFCIDDIEGKIINGEYSGYRVKDLSTGKCYFTEAGIRGTSIGWFIIQNGEPKDILQPLSDRQIHHIYELITIKLLESGYSFENIPDFMKFNFKQGWNNEDDILSRNNWVLDDNEIRTRYRAAMEKTKQNN